VRARLLNIKFITIRAEKVASPVTALQWKCNVAVFTLGLLFAKYSLPEIHVIVGLIRGVAA